MYKADGPFLVGPCAGLYEPGDLLSISGLFDTGPEHVKTAAEWSVLFALGRQIPPHFCFNPVTGKPAPTASGGLSYRADACIAEHRFCLVEFDSIDLATQHRRVAGLIELGLPIAAVLHSGNKSLHSLIRVDAEDAAEWAEKVKPLYQILKAIGADGSTCNPSRLSRMPGHKRDSGGWQRILYLNPAAGRATCSHTQVTA